ncbi:MAG TPA: PilZ domain-containing protein [Pseudobdellovibrionaceae bacterium]
MMYAHCVSKVNQKTTDIFSKISTDEGIRLFQDLANIRGEIVCKGSGEDVYRLTVERANGRQELHCSVPFGFLKPKPESDILGNFFIGGERYFFKSSVRTDADIVILRMDTELFHLQRRQNYRIKIPENYPAALHLSSYNDTSINLKGQLADLSCGGCRVVVAADLPLFEIGGHIDGKIIIKNRDPLAIEGILRYHKFEKSISNPRQIFGVEFISLTALMEGKLFALTMELHREFFSRLNANN